MSNVTTRVWIDNLYHIKPAKYHGVGTLRYSLERTVHFSELVLTV